MPDRKTYLGSGDIAAVAGVSPYSSALDVWARKTGMVPELATTEPMRVGLTLERPIIEGLYAAPRGLITTMPGHVTHPEIPHFGATVDALACSGSESLTDQDGERVVECKVVGTHMQKRWGTIEEDAEDAVPPDVLVQVQWQFGCTGQEIADVVALLGTELRVYRVERDDEMIANLETIGANFWDLVKRGEAPVITDEHASSARELIAALYPRQTQDLGEMTTDEAVLVEQYIEARDAEKAAKGHKETVAALLQQAIADREGILGDGLKATWKAGDKGNVAWKALAESFNPTEAQLFEYTGPSTRRLDVRRVKARR